MSVKNLTGDSGGIRTHDLLLTNADVLTCQPPSLPNDQLESYIFFGLYVLQKVAEKIAVFSKIYQFYTFLGNNAIIFLLVSSLQQLVFCISGTSFSKWQLSLGRIITKSTIGKISRCTFSWQIHICTWTSLKWTMHIIIARNIHQQNWATWAI